MERPGLPIACSLSDGAFERRARQWTEVMTGALMRREPLEDGIRLVLRNDPNTRARLRRLVDAERECCGWIGWAIADGDELVVEARSSDPMGGELLRTWFTAGLR